MIGKLVFPFIRKYLKLIIGIIIASALGFCMIFSIAFSCDSVVASHDTFVNNYRYPQAYIYTEIIDRDILEKIRGLSDVKSVSAQFFFDVNSRLENGRYVTLRVRTFGLQDSSLFYTYEINESADHPNLSVSKKFLDSNGAGAGDLLSFRIGDSNEEFCIGRSVTTPECAYIFINDYVDTMSVDLGYAYMPEDYLIGTEYEGKTNCITLVFEDWADSDETFEAVKSLLGEDYLEGFVYEDSEAKKAIDRNIEPLKKASYILSISFLVIVCCVTFLFLSQIIHQSQKDIAVLRTLGYQIRDISALFRKIILFSDLIAVITGTGVGFLLLNIVIRIYTKMFSIPIVSFRFSWPVFLLAIALTFGAGQLAALFTMGKIKKITPKECFSSEIKAESDGDLAIYQKLNRFSTRTKYGLVSVIKDKKRFFFSAFCITCVVVMIFIAWAFYRSKNALKHYSFDVRMNYDYEVFFDGDANEDFIADCENSPAVTDTEKTVYKKAVIKKGGLSGEQRITGIVENDHLNLYCDFQGEYVKNEDEIILNHRISRDLNAGIGDRVTVQDRTFTVVGITTEYQRGKCYVLYETLEAMGDPDDYSVKINCSDREALAALTDPYDDISAIVDSSIQRQGADDEYEIYDIATVLIIVFALLIGYIIVSNTMQTNLQERKKELSVLRTIGYQISDISGIWLISTLLQTAVALVIGLILGNIVSRKFLEIISVEKRQYPYVDSWTVFLYTACILVAFMIITHVIVIRNIRKWDIVEIVKEKD